MTLFKRHSACVGAAPSHVTLIEAEVLTLTCKVLLLLLLTLCYRQTSLPTAPALSFTSSHPHLPVPAMLTSVWSSCPWHIPGKLLLWASALFFPLPVRPITVSCLLPLCGGFPQFLTFWWALPWPFHLKLQPHPRVYAPSWLSFSPQHLLPLIMWYLWIGLLLSVSPTKTYGLYFLHLHLTGPREVALQSIYLNTHI